MSIIVFNLVFVIGKCYIELFFLFYFNDKWVELIFNDVFIFVFWILYKYGCLWYLVKEYFKIVEGFFFLYYIEKKLYV